MEIKNELLFRCVKLLDLGYVNIIYFTFAVVIALAFDEITGKFDPKKEDSKTKLRIFVELAGIFWLLAISIYIIRNIVEIIPSPFDGVAGYKHSRLKELGSAFAYTFLVMMFATYFREKAFYFFKKMQVNSVTKS